MTDTAANTAKSCVGQLLVTEFASVVLFGRSAHFLYIAVMAPVAVFLFPVWAVEDRNYSAFLLCLLLDAPFLSLMALLIVKGQKLAARALLFIVNIASVVLVIGSI